MYGGQQLSDGGARVVIWLRDGRWCAAPYADEGVKAGETVELDAPNVAVGPVTATHEAARRFKVPEGSVTIIAPEFAPGGSRESVVGVVRVEALVELFEWADMGGPMQDAMDRLEALMRKLGSPITDDEQAAIVARLGS